MSLGSDVDRPAGCELVALPHSALAEEDLFALFRPAGQVQAPRLRSAIKSLKLAALLGEDPLVTDGCIRKAECPRQPYDDAYATHAVEIDSPSTAFDIERLSQQLGHECVYASGWGRERGQRDYTKWGITDDQAFSQCTSLIGRIESYIAAEELAPVLRPGDVRNVLDVVEEWLGESSTQVLRVSLRHLAFRSDVREIVANGLARRLLELARDGRFTSQPLVICLDEAHQFLNKWLGDEFGPTP